MSTFLFTEVENYSLVNLEQKFDGVLQGKSFKKINIKLKKEVFKGNCYVFKIDNVKIENEILTARVIDYKEVA